MTPFEQDIILPALQTLTGAGAISAVTLAITLNKAERTARYYLRRLEKAGVVCRPYGPRKGWTTIDALRLQHVQTRV